MGVFDSFSLDPYRVCTGIGLVLIAIGGVIVDLPIAITGLYLFVVGGSSVYQDRDWRPFVLLIGSVLSYTIVASFVSGILPPGAGLAIGLPLTVITLLIEFFSDTE